MANQGGSHEQHVNAGKQSHKNSGSKQAAAMDDMSSSKSASSKSESGKSAAAKSSSGKQGGSHEQHVNAGKQSHKNSH
ncbi:hypothetical protein BJF93_18635 [Xaviernesmea oryzae]|uniref:Uncharacterized protein n=1 Tax=Xaviernesmea oryzae TaxID=464029 RepID=A0A1Q9B2L3_9HYPH|nr:hypothetical protein [Xaviernesmea oryzae]OLP62238.1 hypothetical protein BJF93_18635 [Xaviernesmea oryzae]SEL92880.1 hypothetical protein SAMN04487976_11561 [Xaviernesmea oryzae]